MPFLSLSLLNGAYLQSKDIWLAHATKSDALKSIYSQHRWILTLNLLPSHNIPTWSLFVFFFLFSLAEAVLKEGRQPSDVLADAGVLYPKVLPTNPFFSVDLWCLLIWWRCRHLFTQRDFRLLSVTMASIGSLWLLSMWRWNRKSHNAGFTDYPLLLSFLFSLVSWEGLLLVLAFESKKECRLRLIYS